MARGRQGAGGRLRPLLFARTITTAISTRKQHTLDDQPLPPVKPDSGYYATTAIAEHAIDMLNEHQAKHREQPFFLYLAFTAPHFPLHALPEDIAMYRDRYLAGWDVLRQERYERMQEMGLVNCAALEARSRHRARLELAGGETARADRPGRSGPRRALERL